jgi:hypothetical protein
MCESIFTWFTDRDLYFGRLGLRLFKSKLQLYLLCSSVKLNYVATPALDNIF